MGQDPTGRGGIEHIPQTEVRRKIPQTGVGADPTDRRGSSTSHRWGGSKSHRSHRQEGKSRPHRSYRTGVGADPTDRVRSNPTDPIGRRVDPTPRVRSRPHRPQGGHRAVPPLPGTPGVPKDSEGGKGNTQG